MFFLLFLYFRRIFLPAHKNKKLLVVKCLQYFILAIIMLRQQYIHETGWLMLVSCILSIVPSSCICISDSSQTRFGAHLLPSTNQHCWRRNKNRKCCERGLCALIRTNCDGCSRSFASFWWAQQFVLVHWLEVVGMLGNTRTNITEV